MIRAALAAAALLATAPRASAGDTKVAVAESSGDSKLAAQARSVVIGQLEEWYTVIPGEDYQYRAMRVGGGLRYLIPIDDEPDAPVVKGAAGHGQLSRTTTSDIDLGVPNVAYSYVESGAGAHVPIHSKRSASANIHYLEPGCPAERSRPARGRSTPGRFPSAAPYQPYAA